MPVPRSATVRSRRGAHTGLAATRRDLEPDSLGHRGALSPLSRRSGARVVLGVLAAHNVAQNFFLSERGYVTGNMAVSALLVGIGRHSGSSWEEMGLGRPDVETTVRLGGVVAAVVAAGGALAMTHPRTRALLGDERAQVTGRGEILRRAMIRFPLGTALFEEVAFRGVLPGLWQREHGTWRADAFSAGVFAVWHLIPTARAQAGNPVTRGQSRPQRVAGVLVGSFAAGVAGLGLSWLRRRTDSLLSPWLVHASVNSIAFLAGVASSRR